MYTVNPVFIPQQAFMCFMLGNVIRHDCVEAARGIAGLQGTKVKYVMSAK